MDADELDNQINDLEHRLERLRALYEQYFLGIEKIEPQVARKDVDRRFWALRKIKIRNTARRFKLQTLIQRYNTFQQHWGRICREIENGTYRRQMLRAERRQGPSSGTAAAPESQRAERAAAAQRAADEATTDLAALMEGDLDLAAEAQRALDAVMKPTRPEPAPTQPEQAPSRPEAPPKIPAARPAALDRLELDDLDLGPAPARPATRTPGAATTAAKPPIAPNRAPPSPARPPLPQRAAPPAPMGKPAPPGRPPAPPPRAAPPLRPPAAPAPRPPSPDKPPVPARPVPPHGRTAGSAAPPGSMPTPGAVPAAAAPKAPTAPQARPARPIRSAIGGSARASEIFGGAPPARPAPKPSTTSGAGLSEDRVKAVHAKLMAAKRQLNEQSGVSVGGLKKQLDASYQRLQAKHRGRQIDFDVVVKDGKAVVKPKIR